MVDQQQAYAASPAVPQNANIPPVPPLPPVPPGVPQNTNIPAAPPVPPPPAPGGSGPVDQGPVTKEAFEGFIVSTHLGTTSQGYPEFYARVGQEHWAHAEDGTFTELPKTYHDLVAYRGAAVRAYKNLAPGDHFIASGYTDQYTSTSTGEVKERFVAHKAGHDMARTRYQVDRTPRQTQQREAPAREPSRAFEAPPSKPANRRPAPGL